MGRSVRCACWSEPGCHRHQHQLLPRRVFVTSPASACRLGTPPSPPCPTPSSMATSGCWRWRWRPTTPSRWLKRYRPLFPAALGLSGAFGGRCSRLSVGLFGGRAPILPYTWFARALRFPLQVKAFLADPSAFVAAAPVVVETAAPAAAAAPAKEAPKEESEESDEDMGFGLFD